MTSTTIDTPRTAEELAELVQRGSDALGEGDLRTALETFEQVVCAFPDRPEGHNNLGALYTSLGDFAKAEACFDRVLEILPGNANILYNRGVVRSRQEKFDTARSDFEAALAEDPNDADLHNNLGVLEYMQGRMKPARKHFRKALRISPENSNAILNLCDVEEAEGRHAYAVALCEEHLEKGADVAVRRRLLELLSRNCRQALDKASQAAEVLLIKDAGNHEARRELGRLIQARQALVCEAT